MHFPEWSRHCIFQDGFGMSFENPVVTLLVFHRLAYGLISGVTVLDTL